MWIPFQLHVMMMAMKMWILILKMFQMKIKMLKDGEKSGWKRLEADQTNLLKWTSGNLDGRDLDLQYDWIENSPDQALVSTAARWLSEKTKESPNDSIQELPEVDWRKLKGKQQNLFLQVTAYCKKLETGDDDQPAPL